MNMNPDSNNSDTRPVSNGMQPKPVFRLPSQVLAALLVVVVFMGGIAVGITRSTTEAATPTFTITNFLQSNEPPKDVELDQLWKAWQILDSRFVPTTASSTRPDDQKKIWGAIKGLTESYGDPYTVFFPPVEAKAFQESVSGNVSGVGMEIDAKDGGIVVVTPLPGTKTKKAGIHAGDRVLTIDDVPADGLTVEKAVSLIRGEEGTVVHLVISRDGGEPQAIDITRAVITVPAIKTESRKDGIFVISLYSLSGVSAHQFGDAL